MYNRLYETMFDGSMYGQGALKQALWAYVIAKMKPNRGRTIYYVELNAAMLADVIGESHEEIGETIEGFCKPDLESRIKDEMGAKLVREGQFLYRVVNGAKYQGVRDSDHRREYMRGYMRQKRQVLKQVDDGKPARELDARPGRSAPGENQGISAIKEKYPQEPLEAGNGETPAQDYLKAAMPPAPQPVAPQVPPKSSPTVESQSVIGNHNRDSAFAARQQPEVPVPKRRGPVQGGVIHVTQAGMMFQPEDIPEGHRPVAPSSWQQSLPAAVSGSVPPSAPPPSFDGQAGLPPLEESDYPI